MLFGLLKIVIWLAGVTVIASFALPYFGYMINMNYWNESRAACQENLRECQKDIIQTGLNGAKESCNFQCVDLLLLIKKDGE